MITNKQTSPVSTETKADLQQKHLQALIERYTKRTKKSKQMTQAYRSVLADPRVPEWFDASVKEMCYLIISQQAQGSRVWDIDGNEYIDIIMGFGSNLLGHNPPFVKEAIQEQLEKGFSLGPQSEYAGEVAELISELTGMERVAFSNTGTEAVMTAIRLARSHTKRNKIALFTSSYHGHSDGVLVGSLGLKLPKILEKLGGNILTSRINSLAFPASRGIPYSVSKNVLMLEYGNPESLNIIKANQGKLAAVIVEPIQTGKPNLQPKEFLHQLRQLTQKSGIALIFDEMVTGFRLHQGGAQAWFGVEADIAAYGKVVGGGMPIGIIAGKRAYLDRIDGGMWNYGDASSPEVEKTFFAGTHCKHPLAIAASRAVLKYLKNQGPSLQEQLNQRTSQFVERLNIYFEANKLPIQMANFGSFFGPVFTEDAVSSKSFLMGFELLRYHLFDKGILLRGEGGGFLSTAHTDEDINSILKAMKDSITELQEAGFFHIP
ncbi:aspartate aminotransferase family protein [Nostoc sp. 'Lobaria pulmonaria (5183) cyanobiont']|uniref:aspartate aminotransferase family protein n=1 Tax=Nostoc sp. 'Lobaria pulmonaria (5183) cyanobiont' TaxID=1618022 RepID=UPI000CF30B22|nr:class III aminotransferase [Nostoc sp. 'Lobaria pulmonaria (5183) cyanobiont']